MRIWRDRKNTGGSPLDITSCASETFMKEILTVALVLQEVRIETPTDGKRYPFLRHQD